MSRKILTSWRDRVKAAIPFGLGQTKPKHFRDMLRIIWRNRDNLGYAWKVLSRGVCDGCALGVAGFHDWTLKGTHLCMTRLSLLRLNTMPALDASLLEDLEPLRSLDNAQLRELGRIPYPMVRERNAKGFRRISWDDALERIAARIRKSDPSRIAFFVTSRGVTNEVYYVAQKAARFLGTNNIDNAARLCHSPSGSAMKYALGVGASTCSYKDWYGTDLIIFFGSNPANDQPVTTKYLHEAKKLGTRVVLVNPYLEPGMQRYWVPSSAGSALFGTDIADWWFPVSQGGDIAFLYGTLKALLARGGINETFIQEHTADWPELKARVESLDFALLEKQAGLSRGDMEEFATLLHEAKNAVLVWSMGITQHVYGGDAVSMVLNLGLARGYVGRDLNGLMPIRGHSSVQGGAEMGAYSTAFPGNVAINSATAKQLETFYGFPISDQPGLGAVDMVEGCGNGQLDLLYCLGGNFLRTLPEPDRVADAMRKVPMRVHQDIILTDQMFIGAAEEVILLPAKTRYEQEGGGIETTTERRVAFSPEIPRQVGEARTEWMILRDLAMRAYPERAHLMHCENAQAVREEIAKAVPIYDGIQTLRKTGDAIQYGGRHLCFGGTFQTPDGKGHFRVVDLPREAAPNFLRQPNGSRRASTASPAFVVSTRRGKQFNTLIYDEIDPLTGAARDAVFMSPEDAAQLQLVQSDRITLVNAIGSYGGRVFLAPIARGNLQVHWPEGNVILKHGIVDTMGGVPDYNAQVTVERSPLTSDT